MTFVYMKTDVKNNDITEMNRATNVACIGWLHENSYLMGGGGGGGGGGGELGEEWHCW